MTDLERLMADVILEPNSGCWLWIGSQNSHGYGQLWLGGRLRRAHRVSYELHKGPIPEGLELHHRCRAKFCVNPEHLEPVNRRQHVQIGMATLGRWGPIPGKRELLEDGTSRHQVGRFIAELIKLPLA
jgi:hypothetical protein